jgi:hypothetical protein
MQTGERGHGQNEWEAYFHISNFVYGEPAFAITVPFRAGGEFAIFKRNDGNPPVSPFISVERLLAACVEVAVCNA